MKKYLVFDRRGCEFFKGEAAAAESDIGNYRITTPGEIFPINGRMYCLEFTLIHNVYKTRRTNKRTGAPLKKPVSEVVYTNAAGIDTQYTDNNGDSWRDLNLENAFRANPRKYTEQNILDWVNSVSTEHYDGIVYTD